MKCQITNNSDMNVDELSPLIDDLASHIQNVMHIKSMPAVTLQEDADNADVLLGKTAQYDPQNKVITVFVTNRHPKDIMRSISHEMIHHAQNERGEFDNVGAMGEGYAQNDEHLRNMEKEAYLKGNMCFRDWEDGYKKQMMESIHRQNSFKRRNKTMKIHKWKNNELNRLLMEKFNFGGKELDEGNCSGNRENKEGEEAEEGDEVNEELENPDKADLDGDGDLSGYEKKRGKAIEKSMKDQSKKKGKKKKEKQEESFRDSVRKLMEEIIGLQ